MVWTLGAVALGAALHPLLQAARRNAWLPFVDTSPERFYDSLLGFEQAARAEAEAEGEALLHREASQPVIEEPVEVPPEDYKVRPSSKAPGQLVAVWEPALWRTARRRCIARRCNG